VTRSHIGGGEQDWTAPLRMMQAGLLAVVLAAAPFKPFELDRFFVPKELALHVTAGLVGLLCLTRARRLSPSLMDFLLALFLALGAASAAFAADGWYAVRALGVSVSGVVLFWCARALVRAGHRRPLVAALSAAAVLAAATSLAQVYGLRTEYFSLNRAPGGTFGNRNFVAHLAAVGAPLLVLSTLAARRRASVSLGAVGLAATAAVLVLTRSRAAWLGALVAAVPALWAGWRAARLAGGDRVVRRASLLALAIGGGAVASLLLPNTLNWNSDSPYLDSVRGVVNYQEGSGHGRLVQYRNSLRMAVAHPLLGVGPGNWSPNYPRFASDNDPSLTDAGVTANPWPSSDWAAFASERGLPAATLLGLAMLCVAAWSWAGVRRAADADAALAAGALGATLAATLVVGAFDAALLLPAPAFFCWVALGTLAPAREGKRSFSSGLVVRRALAGAVAAAAIVFAGRSALQLLSMQLYGDGTSVSAATRAARVDPASYRVRLHLAEAYAHRGECTKARPHAIAALALFPEAPQARRVAAACGVKKKTRG
jgi:O-antigen ligase